MYMYVYVDCIIYSINLNLANASPYHQNISWTSVDVPDDKLVPARMKVIREKTAEKDMVRSYACSAG